MASVEWEAPRWATLILLCADLSPGGWGVAGSRAQASLWWQGLAGQEATLGHMAPQAIPTSSIVP